MHLTKISVLKVRIEKLTRHFLLKHWTHKLSMKGLASVEKDSQYTAINWLKKCSSSSHGNHIIRDSSSFVSACYQIVMRFTDRYRLAMSNNNTVLKKIVPWSASQRYSKQWRDRSAPGQEVVTTRASYGTPKRPMPISITLYMLQNSSGKGLQAQYGGEGSWAPKEAYPQLFECDDINW